MKNNNDMSLCSRAAGMHACRRAATLFSVGAFALPAAFAQQADVKPMEEVVVSASRTEQRRFDAPAAVDAVPVDAFRTPSALVNMSELLSAVPGLQVRNRENYAQDLQISVRGFGTRSTFGVRGVRILIDGIPATMPDGQGQAATASLSSAKRIEVLRGPVAQLYGNAAGGVLQVFTKDPPVGPDGQYAGVTAGAGSYGQRQLGVSAGGGTQTLGGLIDISHYSTDGFRDHSAAERTQINAKVVARPSADTTITGVLNTFDQPTAQDPLGLTHAAFNQNPRQAVAAATTFDTRKKIEQQQAGVVIEHRLSSSDTLNARLYGGTRQVFQTLSMSGAAANSSGGVVDLDSTYGGLGLSWTHKTTANGLPLNWTAGLEADNLRQTRRGFVNNNGASGDMRRNEDDGAANLDLFAQVDWTFAQQWQAIAGVRASRVRFTVDDRYITAASPDDSGNVQYHNTSPVLGLVWHAADTVNLYANLGTGFETPTLAESAYSVGSSGPNFALQPSKSVQGEIGVKARLERHAIDFAVFDARSNNEIVPLVVDNGRTIFQNVDRVQRRGAEISVKSAWGKIHTQVSYTWLDARFNQAFVNGNNVAVQAGNRLPGVPQHSLFADVEYSPIEPLAVGLGMRLESKAYADDLNSDAAPGYAVFNAHAGYAFGAGPAKMYLFGRIDNLLDKNYAGSLIVNDSNGRFFEPAAGRRLFVGLRTLF
jgi:iron complex outermembrane receptor protein